MTQRFTPEDPRREGAFLWNYAGMNVGFFVGFSVAGYFQATESYASLFIFATVGNFVAIILAVLSWKTLADRNTPLLDATSKQFRLRLHCDRHAGALLRRSRPFPYRQRPQRHLHQYDADAAIHPGGSAP